MSEPSLLTRGLKKVMGGFLTKVTIKNIESLSEHFRLVDVQSEDLKSKSHQPGSKIQIDTGNLQFRTYTPMALDSQTGQLRFLAYRREGNPATQWIDSIKVGDAADIMGPRGSLDFKTYAGAVAFFGDETSVGAAKAFQAQNPAVEVFLEVNSLEETETVVAKLKIDKCTLVKRLKNDVHLEKLVESLLTANQQKNFQTAVLTGRLSSIQSVRKLLKARSAGTKVVLRAYWADGKKGLD